MAFAVTVPAEVLTDRLTSPTLALAVGVALSLFVIARLFFHSRYSRASV
ncbi:hypothetical protein [uncultured Chloroflexus sp.]|nr:hypothetical protein [uncultured Chloroflexus sp.]